MVQAWMKSGNNKWVPRFWIPFVICGAFWFLVNLFGGISQIQFTFVREPYSVVVPTLYQKKKDHTGFLIKTMGCSIPHLNVTDKRISEFIEKAENPICNDAIPPLVGSNRTSLFLLNESLSNYHIEQIELLKCCYKEVVRKIPKEHEADNKFEILEVCKVFSSSIRVSEEFVNVVCTYRNSTIYKDFFAFVPLKKYRKKTAILSPAPLNVLVVGLDAISRLNFHRQMPKTAEYLKNISAVELLGYNKVGDNTYPNLVPVLTGLSEDELIKTSCYNDQIHFDKCPFIWKQFKTKGYMTSFGEDSAWMGIFNYMKLGFRIQPTDYMWGFFNRMVEDTIGNSKFMNVMDCVGGRLVYLMILEYITNFVSTMYLAKVPYFAFYWGATLSHDDLNRPQIGDEHYANFLRDLKEKGTLENTVLVFMSDHGIRWGPIRQTYQGRIEERLPFMFLVLPDWYKKQFSYAYNNLVINSEQLTTPYDLHETLKDLLNPFSLTEEKLARRTNDTRGQSLFTKISEFRTCENAGISSHWCTCQGNAEVNVTDSNIVSLANFTVNYMNKLLEGYAQCARLRVDTVINAQKMAINFHEEPDKIEDFQITFQTTPGGGSFEATVRKQTKNHYEIIGTVSRLNLYGKQSSCITDFHLKLYCYCDNLTFRSWQ